MENIEPNNAIRAAARMRPFWRREFGGAKLRPFGTSQIGKPKQGGVAMVKKVIVGEFYKCRKIAEIPQIPLFEAF